MNVASDLASSSNLDVLHYKIHAGTFNGVCEHVYVI